MNKIIFIIITIILGSFTFYYLSLLQDNIPKKEVIIQDNILLSKLKYLGAEYTDSLGLQYIDDLNDASDTDVYWSETILGLHIHNNNEDRIYIKTGAEVNKELTAIAHEYLHYVWDQFITTSEKETIISTSRTLIDNDWYFSDYMQYLKESNTYSDLEIFPIICTERPDQYISTMVDTCNNYIDRSKLIFLYK